MLHCEIPMTYLSTAREHEASARQKRKIKAGRLMIDKEMKTRLILQNQSGGCGDGDDVPLSLLSVSVGCGIATDSVRSTALASQSDGTAFSRRIQDDDTALSRHAPLIDHGIRLMRITQKFPRGISTQNLDTTPQLDEATHIIEQRCRIGFGLVNGHAGGIGILRDVNLVFRSRREPGIQQT